MTYFNGTEMEIWNSIKYLSSFISYFNQTEIKTSKLKYLNCAVHFNWTETETWNHLEYL